jgi:glutaminyl-peptide cyclotransferase
MDHRRWLRLRLLVGLVVIATIAFWLFARQVFSPSSSIRFDGVRALADAGYQMSLGPRIPGSAAHTQIAAWLGKELSPYGWQVEEQVGEMGGHPIRNIIAKRGNIGSWIILGAHYDSRLNANNDPDPEKRGEAVPGANDGASGVAVLLELGRVLPRELPKQIWLVFLDAEDNGNIAGWDWILGSRLFVDRLDRLPDAAIIVDMIGDANLGIYYEKNSDPGLSKQIWDQAALAGYSSVFIPSSRYTILDDHTPFLERGIPAVDIIDFDYPYWHTTSDTLDKISSKSLQAVGTSLYKWLVLP